MFSTLRRLFVLAGSAVASGLLFAPVAFAVNASDGAAGGPNRRRRSNRSADRRWPLGSGH
jgi:hypothetical protein